MKPRWLAQAQTDAGLAVVLALSTIYTTIASADTVRIAAFARKPPVRHLISYDILGNRNHPFPILYISTQHFETWRGEFLIVLPQSRYDAIAAYTQDRISRADCPGNEHIGDVWYTIRIIEHEKNTQRCVLPQALACDYLAGVEKLSGINWSAAELRQINEFIGELRCNWRRP